MPRLLRIVVLIVGVWALVLGASCRMPEAVRTPSPAEDGPSSIYLVRHGWHAGIAIPRAAIADRWGLPNTPAMNQADYLEVGWGEANYYPTPEPGVWTLLRAGAWPTGSVVHVVPISGSVPQRFPGRHILRLSVSPAERAALVHFVARTLSRDADGRAMPVAPGYYRTSRFFASPLPYHVFNNCNHWAAFALRTAGCDLSPRTALTVGRLFEQAALCGEGGR